MHHDRNNNNDDAEQQDAFFSNKKASSESQETKEGDVVAVMAMKNSKPESIVPKMTRNDMIRRPPPQEQQHPRDYQAVVVSNQQSFLQHQHDQQQLAQQESYHLSMNNGFTTNKTDAASALFGTGGWNSGYHTGRAGSITNTSRTNTMNPTSYSSYRSTAHTIPTSTYHRTDEEVDDHDPNLLRKLVPKKRKSKRKASFPQKLMRVLSIDECQHAMRWMPDGCSFCIIDPKALVNSVLPTYFKEAKYSSFVSTTNVCFCYASTTEHYYSYALVY